MKIRTFLGKVRLKLLRIIMGRDLFVQLTNFDSKINQVGNDILRQIGQLEGKIDQVDDKINQANDKVNRIFEIENKISQVDDKVNRIFEIENKISQIDDKINKKTELEKLEKCHSQYNEAIRSINNKINSKKKIKVVFIGYHGGGNADIFSNLYLKFKESSHFDPVIVVSPYYHDSMDGMITKMNKADEYLTNLGIEHINGYDVIKDEYFNVNKSLKPDIVFFDSHYDWNHPYFSIDSFPPNKVLSFFIMYGYFLADNIEHHFTQKLTNKVYRILLPAPVEIELFRKYSPINGINICQSFLGYPKITRLIQNDSKFVDVWKIKDKGVKRIIWAPHHIWAGYSNFLEYKDLMLEISEKYKNQIQIAFKPHLCLYDSLIQIANWTKEEVDAYYIQWETMPNTQLVTDAWIDLFLTSDAMILDSISFMAEFSLTGKPACVLSRKENGERVMKFNELGEKLLFHLYQASNSSDVTNFIEDIVLNENDYKKTERDTYMKENYIGENSNDVVANIYNYIQDLIMPGMVV